MEEEKKSYKGKSITELEAIKRTTRDTALWSLVDTILKEKRSK